MRWLKVEQIKFKQWNSQLYLAASHVQASVPIFVSLFPCLLWTLYKSDTETRTYTQHAYPWRYITENKSELVFPLMFLKDIITVILFIYCFSCWFLFTRKFIFQFFFYAYLFISFCQFNFLYYIFDYQFIHYPNQIVLSTWTWLSWWVFMLALFMYRTVTLNICPPFWCSLFFFFFFWL